MLPPSHTLTLRIIPSATSITLHAKLWMVSLVVEQALYYSLSTDHKVGIKNILGNLHGYIHLPSIW